MITRRRAVESAVGLGVSAWAGQALAAGAFWPGPSSWASVDPASAGLDPTRFQAAVDRALLDQSLDVLVLRGGRIVAERYAAGLGPASTRPIASAAKSMVSILVGIAIDQGKISSVDQRAADFVPQWRDSPKAAITIRHLLTMTSGLDFNGLAVRGVTGDQFQINAAVPLISPPGSRWAYATPTFHLLYHIIARAADEPFEAFAKRNLTGPLGFQNTSWVTNVGQGANGPVTNYYTADCSGRDLARFGLFALRGGQWDGRRLVSASYFRQAISPSQDLNPSYGFLWWENARPGFPPEGVARALRLQFPGCPADTFAAIGAAQQDVVIVPSADLVVVRQGAKPATPGMVFDLVASICASVNRPA